MDDILKGISEMNNSHSAPGSSEPEGKTRKKAAKKSGSENRERQPIIGFRVTPKERAEIEEAAEAEGLSMGSFIREKILTEAQETMRTRKPSFDRVLLAQCVAQVGKVGANLNQIAKRLNQEKGVGLERISAALDDVAAIKTELLKALDI